jgi:hypothetical protein
MNELSTWMRLVLAVFATWRITHLLAREDGPVDIIVRLRSVVGNGMLGKLMDCFYCLSIWIAAPFAFVICKNPIDIFLSWLALSGAACLLERLSQEPVVIQPVSPTQIENSTNTKNSNHAMLRTETDGLQEQQFNDEVRTNSH